MNNWESLKCCGGSPTSQVGIIRTPDIEKGGGGGGGFHEASTCSEVSMTFPAPSIP